MRIKNKNRTLYTTGGAACTTDGSSQAPPRHSAERSTAAERRARRAAAVKRCRARQKRGVALYYVEADAEAFDLMQRFGGLAESGMDDRQAVSNALGRLLRRALGALLREAAPQL
jgi:hypothetical protein